MRFDFTSPHGHFAPSQMAPYSSQIALQNSLIAPFEFVVENDDVENEVRLCSSTKRWIPGDKISLKLSFLALYSPQTVN